MTKTPLVGQKFFGLDLSVIVDRFWGARRQISKRFLLLEFGTSSLSFAQASFTEADVSFTHIRRTNLPENAVERGVPSEPSKMAAMIKDICKEEKIYAHRAAVVLPPEAAFTKLIEIPADNNFLQKERVVLKLPFEKEESEKGILNPLCRSSASLFQEEDFEHN